MKKNGFTLIEMLTVIVILALLLVFIVPGTIKIYTKAKNNTFVDETQLIIRTAEQQYLSENIINNNNGIYYCYDGTTNSKKLNMVGTNKLHYILIGDKTKINELLICDGIRCIYKKDYVTGINSDSIKSKNIVVSGEEGYSNKYDSLCENKENTNVFDLTYKGIRTIKIVVNDGISKINNEKISEKTIDYGNNISFLIEPSAGNKLEGAILENCENGNISGNTLTVTNVTKNQTCTINLEKEKYTINYELNGGNDIIESQIKEYGETLTLSDIEPIREGFKFLGWSEDENADEPKYIKGGTFEKNENTTLYAVWEEIKYTVNVSGSGCIINPSSKSVSYFTNDGNFDITVMEGYNIADATITCGSGTGIISGNILKISNVRENETQCTVNLNKNTYTISYNANGGNGAPNNQTKTHGANLTLSIVEPTRSGYEFLGWSESDTASSATYTAGGTYTTDSAITLYAVWKLAQFDIIYQSNDGSTCPNKKIDYGSTYGALCTPTKNNYTFVGWYKESNFTNKVNSTDIYNLYSNQNLYAKWVQTVSDYGYTGTSQSYTVPHTGTYTLEVWGAQGGGNGGYGGYSKGTISLTQGTKLFVYVGGQGGRPSGGWNGGGKGQQVAGSVNPAGYGGGGATHISLQDGLLSNLSGYKNKIIIVAGAGGGGGENGSWGGSGGGTSGANGSGSCYVSTGGTQTGGGARGDSDATSGGFGYGGAAPYGNTPSGTYGAGGGGAGWYGGGGSSFKSGSNCAGGGAGGSGYVNTSYLSSTTMSNGSRTGSGYARITFVK